MSPVPKFKRNDSNEASRITFNSKGMKRKGRIRPVPGPRLEWGISFAVLSCLPRRVDLDVIGPARLQHLLEPVEAIRWPGSERHKTRTRYLPQSGPKRREHGLSHRRFPLCRFVRQDKRGSQSVREPSWDRWQCTGPLPRFGDLPPSPCSRCPESASGPFPPRRPARSQDAVQVRLDS